MVSPDKLNRINRIAHKWCKKEGMEESKLNINIASLMIVKGVREALRNGWNDLDYLKLVEKNLEKSISENRNTLSSKT